MFGKRKQISPFDTIPATGEPEKEISGSVRVSEYFADSSAFLMPGIILALALILIQPSFKLVMLIEALVLFAAATLLSFVAANLPKWAKILIACVIAILIPMAGTFLVKQEVNSVIIFIPLIAGFMALWGSDEIDYKWDLAIPSVLSLVSVAVGFCSFFVLGRTSITAIILGSAISLGVFNYFISKYSGRLMTTPKIEGYEDFPVATLGTLNYFFRSRMVVAGLTVLSMLIEYILFLVINLTVPQLSDYLVYLIPLTGLLPFISYSLISGSDSINQVEILALVFASSEVIFRRGPIGIDSMSARILLDLVAVLVIDFLAIGYLFVYKRRRIVSQRNRYFKGIPLIVIFISIIVGVIELVVLSMV